RWRPRWRRLRRGPRRQAYHPRGHRSPRGAPGTALPGRGGGDGGRRLRSRAYLSVRVEMDPGPVVARLARGVPVAADPSMRTSDAPHPVHLDNAAAQAVGYEDAGALITVGSPPRYGPWPNYSTGACRTCVRP